MKYVKKASWSGGHTWVPCTRYKIEEAMKTIVVWIATFCVFSGIGALLAWRG
jgi:hypothetical protein